MDIVLEHIANWRYRLAVIGVLILSTFASLFLIIFRWICLGYPEYLNIVWDLFLAWMPFWLATAIYVLHRRGSHNHRLMLSLGIAWLLFFPNAPYMLTEFVHLHPLHNGIWWFDLITTFSFAWNGLILGLLSLYAVHEVVRARFGIRLGCWMAFSVLSLSGVGVALGRFQRFNSWDVIRHPFRLAAVAVGQLPHPEAKLTSLMVAVVLGGFMLLAYLAFWAIVALNDEMAFRQPRGKIHNRRRPCTVILR